MPKPKLTYFDNPASRGEECRLALHLAGVDFEDVRLTNAQWQALKPTSPFGAMPFLELPGHPLLAQSNAILVYVGRQHGLHPKDDFEAARHEAILNYAEDLRTHLSPILRIKDEAEKKAAREDFAANYLRNWAANVEKQIGEGPFLGGAALQVADIKLYIAVRRFKTGGVDHVPTTAFDSFAKLTRLYDAVAADSRIQSWSARH